MDLGLRTSLRADLQLRLSPQILQRIEVLQLPALDLAAMVEQELQENESLEIAGDIDEPAQDERDAGLEELESLYDDDADNWTRPREDAVSAMDVATDQAAVVETLQDHLRRQLGLVSLDERQHALVVALIDALSPRGWLEVPLEDIDVELQPRPGPLEWEQALAVVQSLDPAGIGARDVTECLLLQLDTQGAQEAGAPLLEQLIRDHLDDVAHNRVPRIVRATGETTEAVLAAIEALRMLDPIPGRRFGETAAPVVRPDVVVQRAGEDYEISLENDWVPDLTVSRSYLQMARDRSIDPELRKHIRSKIESARSLIDAVAQRKHTLHRVASELVTRQHEFLESGVASLRPLRMQEVADVLGVHVSTISRAVSGKYMQTPIGIFPMKKLFTGEVPSDGGGEGQSRTGVQDMVRKIVRAEDKHKPLSDEAIVAILKQRHGLDIARRTVTKYRKKLGLASSRARRVYGPT